MGSYSSGLTIDEEIELTHTFPFTAIVSQESIKRAILLSAINPNISGVLLRGPKGTGKSTNVRSLAEVLPDIETVSGCIFSCDPKSPGKLCYDCKEKYIKGNLEVDSHPVRIILVPLNTTKEELMGSIDAKAAAREGTKALNIGLIGKANRGIILIERINLMEPDILKLVLDHQGKNTYKLEAGGFEIIHPAKYSIIATHNTDEGALDPQVLDKCDIILDMERINDIEQRIEIIKRSMEFKDDPDLFRARFKEGQRRLKGRVSKAQETLPIASIPTKVLETISHICKDLNISDYRTNIIRRLTLTNAVFERRIRASIEDFIEISAMSFPDDVRRKFLPDDVEEKEEKSVRTLEIGFNYLFHEEKTRKTYELYRNTLRSGVPAICITTTFPEKIMKEHDLKGTPMYWLTDMGAENIQSLNPKRLDFEITRTMRGFMKEHKEGFMILLDGFEYLVLENSFEKIIKFVKKMSDQASMSGGTIVIPINPNAFTREQATLLKKEFDKVEKL